jgi:hypothetical protein
VLENVATADTARVIAWAYGVEACTAARALAIRDVAISSIALKIFLSDDVELIRWR